MILAKEKNDVEQTKEENDFYLLSTKDFQKVRSKEASYVISYGLKLLYEFYLYCGRYSDRSL